MTITQAKYTEETNNWVSLTFDDGSTGQVSTTDGIRRQHTDLYNEWVAKGNTPEPRYTAEEIESNLKEQYRIIYKNQRDDSLSNNTYTLSDGSVYQVRPEDLTNFQISIQKGVSKKWVLADNSIRLTTVAEMTEIMNNGIDQAELVWDVYISNIESM